ncbi:MAG: hypothetical protein L3K19_07705 [Thermoplasmata archaeon]|nr:hypothetical protein [Thermoplasmata archaeon]
MFSLRHLPASPRSLRRGAKACAAVGLVLLLGALPFTAAHPVGMVRQSSSGGGPGGGNGQNVGVNLTATDAPAFTPNSFTAVAGSVVELRIMNNGSLAHTFTLSKAANHRLLPNVTPAELNAFFNANGSFVNVTLAPHSLTFANLSVPDGSGGNSYEFVSVLPYQFQAGMAGFLNVSAGVSGPPVSLNVNALAGQTLWDPSVLAVNASSYPVAVDVAVTNLGSSTHTWWLSPFPNYNLSFANFTTFFQAHPPLASVNLASSPGGTVQANFTVAKAGVYEYICTVPGHFANGMFGFLYIGVPPPAPAAAPGTAIVQEGVLVLGGTLLGVGGALTLVASFTGRFPRQPGSDESHH